MHGTARARTPAHEKFHVHAYRYNGAHSFKHRGNANDSSNSFALGYPLSAVDRKRTYLLACILLTHSPLFALRTCAPSSRGQYACTHFEQVMHM